MKTIRKVGVIGLLFFDCLIHSTLIFGWSSISVILKEEGFYAHDILNQTAQNFTCSIESTGESDPLSHILVISTGLLGVFLLCFGMIRDFVSYGQLG